jgi:hypothetical protein
MVKTYGHSSAAFSLVLTHESKLPDDSWQNSRKLMTPAVVAQFVAGRYSTSDASEQEILDSKVADGIITLIG